MQVPSIAGEEVVVVEEGGSCTEEDTFKTDEAYELDRELESTTHGDTELSASELQLQLIDQRDQFLFEYEQLEDEILELRNVVDAMQHSIDDANRKWAQEHALKLQLERQVLESIQLGAALQVQPSGNLLASEKLRTSDEAMQPCTPPGTESHPDRDCLSGPSVFGSIPGSDSPASDTSLRMSAKSDAHLALALEAQIELASLREEHRTVIADLVQAKLEIAVLRAEKESGRLSQACGPIFDKAHICDSKKPDKSKSGRRWFS